MKLKGKVHKFGDNIDTDVIIPARYLSSSDPQELAKYVMSGIDPDFVTKIAPGDVILAGTNFGCGSSREHAPLAIKAVGVCAVIAKSFARIFFRNGINIGLPLLECPEAVLTTENGDILEIELENGIIHNLTRGKKYLATPYPPFLLEIIGCGGLVPYTLSKLGR